ncbi:Flp pilus assembly complex ATPase component TadA [Aquibacillus koreensis]|uniref:Flp pilus assembly complex ATPase component TadA n=1 Tax=Aquibacillus koreensis TaxID=279446 RepID=A0A9X3WFQ2_9BACI|nr:competence type IV pilus ATPase ComGA [Aquibacillus koreensis]MCT2537546.1 competence type IV pilus ATPase ComGA [Aquibacillus koreensis]MDC3418992.1 Flp pilus assembly complex ATPase component TadA [Aquibacillus koreensis]
MSLAAVFSNKLLLSAIQATASDIHFCPSSTMTDIYFRVHGKRIFHQSIPSKQFDTLLTYYKFTSGMDIGESRRPQNGTTNYQTHQQKFSLRLSTLPVHTQESLAIRILPQQESLKLEQLFLFPNQLDKIKQWIKNRSGIILFTGPTGSGKTTTLYALLQSLLTHESFQAITLEDPIEKEINNILQVQVNEKAGISYDAGLKAALRHDPDIIMVGEIRDRETAHFAFHASYTGHLVLSTLHAKNALGTIHRLLEMGIKRTDLEQSLIAVASLQLLPIVTNSHLPSRAAILELLDTGMLQEAIQKNEISEHHPFYSFERLRRKAYAYGFTTKDVFPS